MDLKQVPLHHIHQALGAKMVPFAGFEMPVRYTSDKEEHMAVRQGVGVFDVSHMGEFMIRGPKAIATIQRISSNDISSLVDGQAQYGYMPNLEGGIVDDFITYRFNEEEFMLVVNASNIEKDWNWISQHNQGAMMENISDDIVLLAVQGPKATEVLQQLTALDLGSIKYYHFTKGQLAGCEMIISATGYTGAGGFELYIQKNDAEVVWKKIFEAGAGFNIQPIGLGARDTLRLEMGFCLYGNDIDDNTSPLEAGLGWVTKFTKDFVNADELKKQKEKGVSRKLVGLQMVDKGIPRHGYPILDMDGKPIGQVTSGSISPVTGQGIALGYIQMGSHQSGTEVYVEIREKHLKANIVKPPFI